VSWFREWLEGGEPAATSTSTAPERPAAGSERAEGAEGAERAERTERTASSAAPSGETAAPYPGERFGLPETGPGSVATLGRRAGQFLLDAVLAGLLAAIFTFPAPPQNWSLLTWAIIMIVPVAVVGATPAMALLGMRVVRLDRPESAGVGPLWTLVRTVSVFFVIPALIVDRDSRGIHDRASRTVVVRTR
jgi:hypothetical protein